jgi:putative transcription factor
VEELEEEVTEEIVDDYNIRIKRARELRLLTQEGLARAIAEKESAIHKLESGQLKPNIKLANKLEQFLNIKLTEEHKEEKKQDKKKTIDLKDDSLTIGDLIKFKEEK